METKALPEEPVSRHRFNAPALIRSYIFILIMGGWMGGFTFYALIVIPTAQNVLGGERDVGFITQQVTNWLNLIGVAALLILLWVVAADWRDLSRRMRTLLAVTWATMVASQAGLFIMHPLMDSYLEVKGHKVHNYGEFDRMHDVYLVFATVQWIAAMLHIWLTLYGWRCQHKASVAAATPPQKAPAAVH
jgi:hypothetical protein